MLEIHYSVKLQHLLKSLSIFCFFFYIVDIHSVMGTKKKKTLHTCEYIMQCYLMGSSNSMGSLIRNHIKSIKMLISYLFSDYLEFPVLIDLFTSETII